MVILKDLFLQSSISTFFKHNKFIFRLQWTSNDSKSRSEDKDGGDGSRPTGLCRLGGGHAPLLQSVDGSPSHKLSKQNTSEQ